MKSSALSVKGIPRLAILALLVSVLGGCGYTRISMNEKPVFQSTDKDYPKAIVVYDSWSGNTGNIAKAIAEELKAPAVPVDQVGAYVMSDFDLIVVGSPVHGGRPTAKITTFLSTLPKPPASAVFVTFGAPLFGPWTANVCLDNMEDRLQGSCLGRFKCQGFHHIIRTYPSHPDEKDKADARQFAAELLNRCRNNE